MANIDSMRRDIINIPCKEPEEYQDAAVRMAYRVGHRDARHAAFDIVCGIQEPAERSALELAAPELLEAVETLLDCFVNDPLGWMDSSDIAIEKAYDAIHKAKGE